MLKVCPQCSHTWEEFETRGLLGCSRCYSVFAEDLKKFTAVFHGVLSHIDEGRPEPVGETTDSLTNELILLREKLASAIILEKFEEATALKKKISELEQESGLD